MPHLGILLHLFNFTQRDMALLQRNKHGFQLDNTELFSAMAGNKRPSCSAVHQQA